MWPSMIRTAAATAAYGLTAYFAVGAAIEERRIRGAYGRAYEDYRRSGVPFYVPSPVATAGDPP